MKQNGQGSNTTLKWLVGILVVIIIGLISYIVYSKTLRKPTLSTNNIINSTNTTTSTESSTPTSNWKTYNITQLFNLSFKYPQNWLLCSKDSEKGILTQENLQKGFQYGDGSDNSRLGGVSLLSVRLYPNQNDTCASGSWETRMDLFWVPNPKKVSFDDFIKKYNNVKEGDSVVGDGELPIKISSLTTDKSSTLLGDKSLISRYIVTYPGGDMEKGFNFSSGTSQKISKRVFFNLEDSFAFWDISSIPNPDNKGLENISDLIWGSTKK